MQTRDIPASEWHDFSEAFSRQHEGWLVSLHTHRRNGTRECVARDVPFRGMAVEADGERQSIVIMVDGSGDRHLTHTVSRPSRLTVEQTDEGADASVSVSNELGTPFTVEFRTPMPISVVDGIAKETNMPDAKEKTPLTNSLREWGFDLARFETKARKSMENARGDLSEVTGVLRESLKKMKQVLLDLQVAREPVATELKSGFERAWDEIEQAFARARQKARETRNTAATRNAGDDWLG